jgi:SAM-dependent methyltransferase
VHGDGENIALPGGIFDVVTHFSLLSYLPDPDRGLAEAHRLLRPGGHLILDTVSADWWMLPLYLKRWGPRHALTRPLSTASVREMLAKAGFEVLDFKYCWSVVDFPVSAACGVARRYRALSFVLPLARAYYAATIPLGRRLGNGAGLRWLFREYIVLARKSI